MNDQQLVRYSRHLLLPELDYAGQQRLLDARVLVVGVGGLGAPAAIYLAASGVGRITLMDPDRVDLSNLQRQIAHTESRLGQAKVDSARQHLELLNSDITIDTLSCAFSAEQHQELVAGVDVVLDCSDNFATRFAVNAVCHRQRRPLVSAAAIRFEGQLTVFPGTSGPCYSCLYPQQGDTELRCSENGILAPVVGVMGCLQALEALKLLAGVGEPLVGRLLLFDGLRGQFRELRLPADPGCAVCGTSSGFADEREAR